MKAKLRFSKDGKYLTILCHKGHVISQYKLTRNFAGSLAESMVSQHQAGTETGWDRLSKECCGHGH